MAADMPQPGRVLSRRLVLETGNMPPAHECVKVLKADLASQSVKNEVLAKLRRGVTKLQLRGGAGAGVKTS